MQDKYIQAVRDKLQRRVRRLKSASHALFPSELRQFFAFFDSHPLLCAVRDELLASIPKEILDALIKRFDSDKGTAVLGNNEAEQAGLAHYVLKLWKSDGEPFKLVNHGQRYGAMKSNVNDDLDKNSRDALDRLRQAFLEPFYEYVDEHIDDQQAILYFLRKYKHRSEWFRKAGLHKLASDDTGTAEKLLGLDLYEYLHDQGIDFSIEPKSASGRPDLITEQVGDSKVVADAKVFWPERSKGKPYIVSGFNQVYTYLRDYNEPFGYLVIFKMCQNDLKFMVPPTTAMFPSLSHNNKTVFFIVVDICEYEGTASKRRRLKVNEITAEDLVHSVESPDTVQEEKP